VPLDENTRAPSASTATAGAVTALSAIENEIPAYRAISPGALVSLVLGIVSILCYASQFFLVTAAAAIGAGALAVRKIRQRPDTLTGEKFAQAGIALGLIFGLTSYTITTVQGMLRERAAVAFGRQFELVLNKGSLDDVIWYSQHPDRRKDITPATLVTEMKSKQGDARMFDMQTQSFRDLKARLDEPGASTRFRRVEGHSDDGQFVYAYALYEIDLPAPKKPDEKTTYALAILQATRKGSAYEWWVSDLKYPYTPSSYVAPDKPVDEHGHGEGDGHGH
jgi:Domain of unknown function (DUF4190)